MPVENAECVARFARGLAPESRVLDVGCGLKPYAAQFAHCEYVGVDVEQSGRRAHEKQADHYYDGRTLPFADESFDAVLCTQVLEHCVDPERLTAELRRVLRTGGVALVTVPFLWGEHETPYDFRRYSSFGVERLLEGAKFEIVERGKMTQGVDAIRVLVDSEINHYRHRSQSSPASWFDRLLRTSAERVMRRVVWPMQLRLWNYLYAFERIYIDNYAVARKP